MSSPRLTLAVLIVTYQRSELLRRCLESLMCQTRQPDSVIVAGVAGDAESAAVVSDVGTATRLPCVWLEAPQPSIVEQTNLGLATCRCDVVVLTNDDAEPFPDWLARIEPHYADPTVGGVGGRDYVHRREGGIIDGPANVVGQITWFGRVRGNHHLSYPRAVDVDVLKGVNMSCRRELMKPLDRRMVSGGRWHWEIDTCFQVRSAGRRLVFDPAICVDHYHYNAPRSGSQSPDFVYATSHNLTLNLIRYLPLSRRIGFLIYTFLWGDYPEMGLAVFARTYLQEVGAHRNLGFGRLLGVAMAGKMRALRSAAQARGG